MIRAVRFQSHLIFYIVDESGVLIVRVLHETMHVTTYLGGETADD